MSTRIGTSLALATLALLAFAPGCTDSPDGASVDAGDADAGLTLEQQLDAIPGLTWTEVAPVGDFRIFDLHYDQPVDHDHPEGQHFSQHARLLHRDAAAPMVLATSGYALSRTYGAEPTRMLAANQLSVEERYFDTSTPVPTDWSKLDIRQAAEDHHRLTQALKSIYHAAWIATGASKGGMTSVYHARFHPEDLAGVVAYVAPISFGAPDERYLPFFETVGDPACRQRLRAFQRQVLLHREAMEARVPAAATANGSTFTVATIGQAVENAAANFEFAFWQYQDPASCSMLPGPDASDDELFAAIQDDVLGFDDARMAYFRAYYVQANTQLGFPAEPSAHIADLLVEPELTGLPEGCCAPYSAAAMHDVADWVASSGRHLLFVYGEDDPYSAGRFDLGHALDSFELFAPGDNHGSNISALVPSDQAIARAALTRWTGVPASLAHLSARELEPPEREPPPPGLGRPRP